MSEEFRFPNFEEFQAAQSGAPQGMPSSPISGAAQKIFSTTPPTSPISPLSSDKISVIEKMNPVTSSGFITQLLANKKNIKTEAVAMLKLIGPLITELDLRTIALTGEDLTFLAKIYPHIEKLALCPTQLDPKTMKAYVDSNKKLKELHLVSTSRTDSLTGGHSAILEKLQEMVDQVDLKEIASENIIKQILQNPDKPMPEMCKRLGPKVHELDLRKFQLEPEQIAILAKYYPNLTRVNLQNVPLTNASLEAIALWKNLQVANLEGSEGLALDALQNFAKNCSKLEGIKFTYNSQMVQLEKRETMAQALSHAQEQRKKRGSSHSCKSYRTQRPCC